MSGYLRLNPASATGGYFEFVLADQVEFSTDASPVPKQITMKVGDKTYAHDVPTNGSSGFFLVRLHSRTLALDRDFFYVTNKPDGSQDPSEAKRMADDLAWASSTKNDHGELLVMLQAFGTPKGTSPGWLAAARAIARLGGNGQLFAQLNLGGAEEPHQGRLAFVGHSAMDTFAAESSQSLTGHADDALLDGLLARGRDDQYEPLAAGPVGGVNFDLVRIVNRPSLPGGGFPTFAGGQAAAADFLGRNPNAIGVCDQAEVTCDVRKEYYLDYGADWATILTRLGQANLCPSGGGTDAAGTAFTKDDCNAVREEFFAEIGDRNKVEQYFGPKGLQAPFLGGGGAGAIVDITKLANEITTAVEPPKANNAVSDALGLLSNIAKVAAFSALVCPPCGPVAGGLTGSFAIAAYATKQNGSADLIGPKVVAKAADLGVDLFDRYRAASSNFTTEAMIVMSDWSKLREVAAAVDTKKWRLGYTATAEAQIRLATKQVIYEALLPVAYPILYDLGTGITHASYWRCIGNKGNKTLFQQSGTGTEVFWRMSDPSFLGEDHLIVVGAHHAVGHLSGAYIPSPPESVTGPLFRDSAEGGIGLYKLDFYSPQYFRSFPGSPQVFQQSDETSGPFKKEYGFHNCDAMPDPPGNSG
jgi:hypothetical protein